MAAYLIADIDVTNVESYAEYRRQVPAVVAAYGGRFLVRGGAVHRLEGNAELNRVVVIEFPSIGQLRAFYDSPEYGRLIPLRQRASRGNLFAVEGV
jgi:uncharacterized protein (DUF1330 family)